MFNELERLFDCMELYELLVHYVELSEVDRECWQDRLSEFHGLQGRELTKMYGELIAYGWLEQNTGDTPILEPGRFACCYRATAAGRRALREAREEMMVGA